MKNQPFLYVRLVLSVIINIVLFNIFLKVPNITTKIIFSPFLICGLASFGETVALLYENPKYVKIMRKLYILSFLLYWFGFLISWCYLSFCNQEYIMLLFSIPFWIVGISKVKNSFFKERKKQ